MKKSLPGFVTFGIFVAIAFLGLIAWISILTVVWLFLAVFGLKVDLFVMLESISTAIAAATVFSAGFLAIKELNEISTSRHLNVSDRLFEELNSFENIEARRWIFLHLPDNVEEGVHTIPAEGRAALKRVLNSLDHVAFLTQDGWIPEEMIMPWMHPMIAKTWKKLEPYVIYERERRNEPYYYQKVSELANRCTVWREKNLGSTEIKWVDDAL